MFSVLLVAEKRISAPRVLLEIFDGLAPEAVIPAKAGIQVFFLGPRFRGDDNQESPPSGNP